MAALLPPDRFEVRAAVRQALDAGRPVVALESTALTHGLPHPENLALARTQESEVRRAGATPATIACLDGRATVGLDDPELVRLCTDAAMRKLAARDLAAAIAAGWSGGTTVSATMVLAQAAGIRVLATGGIGGVHRGGSGDVSADLTELARTPVTVVCSGAKAILDLARTLEWLETASVPVVGWQTDSFPEFFASGGSLPVSARVDTPAEAAAVIRAQLGFGRGLLLCVPCPAQAAVPPAVVARALTTAEDEATRSGVIGQALTPFLLKRLAELTEGATLNANLALLRNNAAVAAAIAAALVG